MVFEKSPMRGIWMPPTPPEERGVLTHAKCVWCESVDTPTMSAPTSRKLAAASLNATISVGHTNCVTQHARAKRGGHAGQPQRQVSTSHVRAAAGSGSARRAP